MHFRLAIAAGSVSATERAAATYVSFAPEGSGLAAADLDRAAGEADRAEAARLAASPRFAGQRLALVRGTPARTALEVP